MKRTRNRIVFALLCFVAMGLCFVDCIVGASTLSAAKALQALVSPLGISLPFAPSVSENEIYIVLFLRLPRVLFSAVAGAGLAVCGMAFQALFRNPLSDPYVLGVSSGASLGAAVAIVLGAESMIWGVSLSSFAFAVLTVLIIIRISSYGNRIHTSTLLLAGISINFLISAIISLLMVLNKEQMEKITFWTMGSLSYIDYKDLAMVACTVVIGTLAVLFHSRDLNALLIGNQTAQSLGVNVERTKRSILLICTLMVSTIVSCSGVIGFIGLVIPHMMRTIVGADNRKLLPFSIVGGSIFMTIGDILSKSIIPPSEIPPGSITALIGAPFFIYLLFNSKKRLNQ